MFKEIKSHTELTDHKMNAKRSFLLLYKKGAASSDCAFSNVLEAAGEVNEMIILHADVNVTRDIHQSYSVETVPSLLEFRNGEFVNVIRGCNDAGYYRSLFSDSIYSAPSRDENVKPAKRVTVYSTPTCSWCNTLKTYLKQHNVKFNDVDVSRDPKAADALVKRSGQTGVPQTDINGELIVGFDRERINRLLGIRG